MAGKHVLPREPTKCQRSAEQVITENASCWGLLTGPCSQLHTQENKINVSKILTLCGYFFSQDVSQGVSHPKKSSHGFHMSFM